MSASDDSNIRMHRLENGITLVFEPMPWLHTLSMAFLLPIGSVTDPEDREGSATVLHDGLSRGAGTRDSRTFNDELDGLGVRRGGGSGRETTSLSASMLARSLPQALPLLADMLRRPRLEDDEFTSARDLAQEELASLDDSPAQRVHELLAGRFFTSAHSRSIYGTQQGLAALEPDGVRQDYRQRFAPDGMVITVAGGARWEELLSEVERNFGDWTGTPPRLPEIAIAPPERHHEEAQTSQVHIGLAYPALPPDHQDWYQHSLAMNVLSGGSGSRLFMEVREKRGLVYSVHAGARALRGFGYVIARAGTTPERAQETLDVVLEEIGRLSQGVDGEELERARTGILSQLVMQGESSGARAGALALDMHLRGEPRSLEQIKSLVSAVSLAQVNSFLAQQNPAQPTMLTLGPAPVRV